MIPIKTEASYHTSMRSSLAKILCADRSTLPTWLVFVAVMTCGPGP